MTTKYDDFWFQMQRTNRQITICNSLFDFSSSSSRPSRNFFQFLRHFLLEFGKKRRPRSHSLSSLSLSLMSQRKNKAMFGKPQFPNTTRHRASFQSLFSHSHWIWVLKPKPRVDSCPSLSDPLGILLTFSRSNLNTVVPRSSIKARKLGLTRLISGHFHWNGNAQ